MDNNWQPRTDSFTFRAQGHRSRETKWGEIASALVDVCSRWTLSAERGETAGRSGAGYCTLALLHRFKKKNENYEGFHLRGDAITRHTALSSKNLIRVQMASGFCFTRFCFIGAPGRIARLPTMFLQQFLTVLPDVWQPTKEAVEIGLFFFFAIFFVTPLSHESTTFFRELLCWPYPLLRLYLFSMCDLLLLPTANTSFVSHSSQS